MRPLAARVFIVGVVLIVGMATALANAPSESDHAVLRLAYVVSTDHPYHRAATELAQRISERTAGNVQIQLHPAGELAGGEREQIERLLSGDIDIVISGTAVLFDVAPQLSVLDFPFLFDDLNHVDAVLDGPIGDQLLQAVIDADAGLYPLAFIEQGFRHLTNRQGPVTDPGDLAGLTIRVQENPIHKAAMETLGATVVSMPWNEALSALREDAVDGQENPLTVIDAYAIHEVHGHLALTRHVYSPALILVNADAYRALSPQQRQALADAAREVAQLTKQATRGAETEALQRLIGAGMHITYPDAEAFREAMSEVYATFASPEIGALLDAIAAAGQ